MDDTKAIESLTCEMELTRNEMAALTDGLARLTLAMKDTAAAETRLAELIEERSKQRGFWRRLAG